MPSNALHSRPRLLSSASWCALFLSAWQAAAAAAPADWQVKSWRTADGLPQNSVEALEQTPDGYWWLGTLGGLARFDGVRFITYGLADGLEGLNIMDLLEDGRGGLWVATLGGLSHGSGGRFTTFTTADGLAHDRVFSLAPATKGGLWVGTQKGLQHWDGKRFITMGETEGLPLTDVSSLAVTRDGALWASMGEIGLFRQSGGTGKFEAVPGPDGGTLKRPWLLATRDGALWASLGNGRILRLRENRWEEFNAAHGVPFSRIYSLAEGPDGEVWGGSAEEGLYVFREGKFHPVAAADGRLEPAIRSVRAGADGAVWVGTRSGGLSRLTPSRVTGHPVGEPGRRGEVNGLVEEPAGHFWVTSFGGGLVHGPLGDLQPVTGSKELGENPYLISGLHLKGGGSLFFGYKILLMKADGAVVPDLLSGTESWTAAAEDEAGVPWLGSAAGGLWRIAGDVPEQVTGGKFPAAVSGLVCESGPVVWVATVGAGLFRWEAGKSRRWGTAEGLPTGMLQGLHRDAAGTLWIGTQGGGLAWLKDGAIHSVGARQGFTDSFVTQILEDDEGHLWLGTHRGILRLSKQELEDVAAGRAEAVHPLVLDESDGMPAAECTGSYMPAGLKSQSGRLLFSTVRGVAEVDPQRFRTIMPPPPLRIEEVLLDGKALPPGEPGFTIPPGPREVEIRYTAFNDAKPEQIRFRHRLGGPGTPWTDVGHTRSASFPLLPPGDYTFEVSAANEDGRWSAEAAAVRFTIQPRFWQTLGFRLAAAAVLLAAGGGAAAWMTRHRVRRARELEQLARAEAEAQQHLNEVAHLTRVATLGELSSAMAHELNQPLTAILCNAELARIQLAADPSASADLREMIDDIIDDDKRASEVIRRLRTLLQKGEFQPQALDANEVIGEVLRLMNGNLTSCGVTVITDLGSDLPPVSADRVQLQQVLINLIQNAGDAMGESEPGRRTLSIRSALNPSETVLITVADRGPGIVAGEEEKIFEAYKTTKANGLGLGLPLSRSIIFAHGGKLWAANRPEGGAAFSFTLQEWKGAPP